MKGENLLEPIRDILVYKIKEDSLTQEPIFILNMKFGRINPIVCSIKLKNLI